MRTELIALAAAFLFTACAPGPGKETFDDLAREFVFTSLAFSPVAATQAGYHRHGDLELDAIIDDYSSGALERQRRWYQEFRLRLMRSIDPDTLDPEARADYDIIDNQISLALLELHDIQSYRHNPTLYVELAGNALFSNLTLEYAPKPERFRHIISRLRQVPRLLSQARRNLVSAPQPWTRVALEESEGTVRLIETTLRDTCPPELRSEYDTAAETAVAALGDFSAFLQHQLMHRTHDWRLGNRNYARKFRHVLATSGTPEEVLAAAEEAMDRTRSEMYDLAAAMIEDPEPADTEDALNTVVSAVLEEIAERHATPRTYFADARRDLEEARRFVRERQLVSLPGRDNLQLIETPEFMRGIYAVGGFNPAPPLEPELGAFYWLTPIPPEWSHERVLSKLREYNYYGLKLLTIHEAIPGHYVQFEYANRVQPPLRRILRSVFGNGPYIEGWAVFATEMMLDAGYLNDDPALRLTFLKQQLRVFANAILDVRLHTMGMTDEEALELMMEDAFQEREEAEAKLQRAKLSSAQLPTYFVGWLGWHRVRGEYERLKGTDLALHDFNRRVLEPGAISLPALARLLVEKSM